MQRAFFDPSLQSLFVPHSMTVSLHFKERHYLVDMEIQLHRFDYLPDIVQHVLIDKHHLPRHLERTALDLLREYVQDEIIRNNQDIVDNYFGNDENYAQEDKKFSNKEQQHKKTGEEDFSTVYHKVFHSSAKTQLHLLKIQQQMNVTYISTISERDAEIENLRRIQAKEMSNICDSNVTTDQQASDLSQVVHLHMAQIQELEAKHTRRLHDLKCQFKKQFRKFVFDLYNDMENPEGISLSDDIDEDLLRKELESLREGLHVVESADRKQNEDSTTKYGYISSLLGYIQQKAGAATSTTATVDFTSPVPDISPSSAYTPFPDTKHTLFRVTMPRLTLHVIYDSASILSQITQRRDGVNNDDDELIARAASMHGLVGGGIRALLVNCYPCVNDSGEIDNFVWTSSDWQKISFDAMESCAPELHFDDIDDQVAHIRRIYPKNELPQIGDYFVTRHSNLAHVHLAYHLITQEPRLTTTALTSMDDVSSLCTTPNSDSDYNAIMQGVNAIIASLDECGTRELSVILPFMMTHRHPRVKQFRKLKHPVYSGDEILFQMEDLLSCIKKMRNPLTDVYLFLPSNPKHSSGHFSKQLEILIRNIFESPNDTDDFTEVIILSNTTVSV